MKAIRFNATIPRYAAGLAMSRVRSSLLWSGRSCTYVEEVPVPDLIGPDWVRIRTRLGGICGTDIGTIHLHTSPYFSPFASFPYTIGHENVGVIAEVGPEAGDWQVGQRVVVEPLGSAADAVDRQALAREGVARQRVRRAARDLGVLAQHRQLVPGVQNRRARTVIAPFPDAAVQVVVGEVHRFDAFVLHPTQPVARVPEHPRRRRPLRSLVSPAHRLPPA